MTMNAWGGASATTVGQSHVSRGRGSDDAIVSANRGKWTAIVACDGAGSSSRSREGADFVSSAFANQLLEIASEIEHAGPGPWLNDALILGILDVRKNLASIVGSYDLSDLHCTLVAVLVSDAGGVSVHIGDGAVFIGSSDSEQNQQVIVHSEPENGEYSNETFFVTETTWLKSLRIKPLGACDWVVVTTDGAASLLLNRSIKYDVFAELFLSLATENNLFDIAGVLEDLIKGEYARGCSSDDKTIGLAFRAHSVFSDCWKKFESESKVEKLATRAEFAPEQKFDLPYANPAVAHNCIDVPWVYRRSLPNFLIVICFVSALFALLGCLTSPTLPHRQFVPALQCSQPLSNQPYPCGQ